MKANQVRDMSVEDLKVSLKDNFESLENLRFRHAIGQLESYKSISNTKKDIARVYTILREKELKINENLKKEVRKTVKSDKKALKDEKESKDVKEVAGSKEVKKAKDVKETKEVKKVSRKSPKKTADKDAEKISE